MKYEIIEHIHRGRDAWDIADKFTFVARNNKGTHYRGWFQIFDNGNGFVWGIFRVSDGASLSRENAICKKIEKAAYGYISEIKEGAAQ